MTSPLAKKTERPNWICIEVALKNSFDYDGYARLDVLFPDDSYIKTLGVKSCGGQIRIVITTRDEDPKNEILEWWQAELTPFRGTIHFGDDDWDARTVCDKLTVAEEIFRELYEEGALSGETLLMFRSPWSPMPR